jgi:hypothetical protein
MEFPPCIDPGQFDAEPDLYRNFARSLVKVCGAFQMFVSGIRLPANLFEAGKSRRATAPGPFFSSIRRAIFPAR